MIQALILGSGGHAKVVIEIFQENADINIVGLIDKDPASIGKQVLGVPVIGTDEELTRFYESGIHHAIVAVGGTGDNFLRFKLFDRLKEIGFQFVNAIHPRAIISKTAVLGSGDTVMAGSIINAGTVIGANAIINSGSIIEHDCRIGAHVHIAPRTAIAGGVTVGELTHVGMGAVVIQGRIIGNNVLIGAGAVIIKDVPDNAVVVGNPGRVIRYRELPKG
ncbi:MAG: acetyltransferase [Bacteroidota bacterium]